MIREQRLDPVVHYLEVRGSQAVDEFAQRIDAALASGVRKWVTPLSLPRIEPPATA